MTPSELLTKAKTLPTRPGVYVMKDAEGREIYVGKAKNLRRRVASYFQTRHRLPRLQALIQNIDDFEYTETESELEALLLESRLIKDLQPKYNVMLRHNELYPYLEITMEEDFPQVLVTRRKDNPKSRYFGPFIGAKLLREGLRILQSIFRFRLCQRTIQADDPRLRYARGCLNLHIRHCDGPCCGGITKEAYRKRIHALCRFLSGQKQTLLEELQHEMEEAAAELRFEEAASLRDMIEALQYIGSGATPHEELAPFAPVLNPTKGLEKLQSLLHLSSPPRYIEGMDIANLQGKEAVGALVTFFNAVPHKEGYRRFRIRTVEGQDDFACIAEVVRRRYGRLREEGKPLPDLLLIDGGKGQLRSAARALEEIGISTSGPPILLALVKEEETLFRWGEEKAIPISKRNEGLRLLMHVRDEAHRFAQHYHHILRRKAMFGEGSKTKKRAKKVESEGSHPRTPHSPFSDCSVEKGNL